MFRANKDHVQAQLFSPGNTLPATLRKRLEQHWSTVFYEKVFRYIDEGLFAGLFGETGRPNFPVNIFRTSSYMIVIISITRISVLSVLRISRSIRL
jgi:hypothetical protein